MTNEIQTVNRTLLADTGWKILGRLAMEPTRKHDDDEYFEQFQKLRLLGDGCQAWAGDTYLAAADSLKTKEEKGDKAAEIAEAAGFEKRTIRAYGYICRNVDASVRTDAGDTYPELTFGHMGVVAPLEPADQKTWLHKAGKGGWSVAQLRSAMRNEKGWNPRPFNAWSPGMIEEWQQPYPGQTPGDYLLNILYYTTNKGDLVIDPFAGGGNMALACGRMERKCKSYDINPKFKGITAHDARDAFPDSGARLVYLDPPWWKQKRGEYNPEVGDLSNVNLGEFHAAMLKVFKNAHTALASGGFCVFVIGATQSGLEFHDHALELYADIRSDWQLVNRVSATYPTQQYSGNDVTRALADKQMLNLYTNFLFLVKR